MKTLMLIGPGKGLSSEEKNLLWDSDFKGAFTDKDLDARVPIFFGVKKDTTNIVVPYFFFPSEEDGRRFFRTVGNKISYNAFTTLPLESLRAFDEKEFDFGNRQFTFAVKISLSAFNGYDTYSNRLICFERTSLPENKYNLGTRIEFKLPSNAEEAFTTLHPVYLDPVKIDLGRDKLNLLYRSFFRDKEDFPIVLPPVNDNSDENSYFAEPNKKAREEIKKLIETKFVVNNITASLGYKVWDALNKPVFHDFLKDGAFFNLKSKAYIDGNEKLLAFDEDGEPFLEFIYPSKDSSNTDFICQWRKDFFFQGLKASEAKWSLINKAVLGDMRDAVGAGFTAKSVTVNSYDPNYWNDITLPPFTAGSKYYYTIIENFAGKLSLECQNLIKARALDTAIDGDFYDSTRAREAFCGYFFKYPFVWDLESSSGWTTFLIQLVHEEGWVDPIKFVSYNYHENLLTNDDGEITYELNHRSEEILTIRLLLPANAYLRSRFNNILDHSNAKLDNNFILD